MKWGTKRRVYLAFIITILDDAANAARESGPLSNAKAANQREQVLVEGAGVRVLADDDVARFNRQGKAS